MEEGGRKPPFLICAKIVTSRSNNERPTRWPTAGNTVVSDARERKLVSTAVGRDWNTVARTQAAHHSEISQSRTNRPAFHSQIYGPPNSPGKRAEQVQHAQARTPIEGPPVEGRIARRIRVTAEGIDGRLPTSRKIGDSAGGESGDSL